MTRQVRAIGIDASRLWVLVAGVALLLAGVAAQADVYLWKDPATGKTRMTNIVPPWLRDPKPGVRIPKVEVIRDGKVMDPATAFAAPETAPLPQRRSRDQEAAGAEGKEPGAAVRQEIPLQPNVPLPPGVTLLPDSPGTSAGPAAGR